MMVEPCEGEAWRNAKGAIRFVRSVEDGGYSVIYSRPAPASPEWLTVSMVEWLGWVDSTNALRVRKASPVLDKDWEYITR